MIESRNLFKLQSKLTKNNRTIPVKAIEKDYVLSWILIGIAKSKISDMVTFKGGTALKKFYFPNYRFSEDLDFTLLKYISIEDFEKMLQEVTPIGQKVGEITEQAARWTGLNPGTTVATAMVNAHAAMPASTVVSPGKMVIIIDTSNVHLILSKK